MTPLKAQDRLGKEGYSFCANEAGHIALLPIGLTCFWTAVIAVVRPSQ